MVQHIGVKTLKKNNEYKGNFANIYNLLGNEYNKYSIINSIDIYGDTIIKKEELIKLKEELIKLKEKNNKDIDNFINFINEINSDLLFIGD